MTVKRILEAKKRDVVTISPDVSIATAMEELIKNRIRCLAVVGENKKLIGILSLFDIFRAIHDNQEGYREVPVSDVMTSDVLIGLVDDDVNYIASMMTDNKIRHIPIMDNKKLVGMVSIGDIVAAQMKHMEIENRYLRLYMEGTLPHSSSQA